MILDVILIWGAGLLTYLWYLSPTGYSKIPSNYQLIILTTSLLLLIFPSDTYRYWRDNELWVMLRSISTAWLRAVVITLIWLFISKTSSEYSRVWLLSWSISTLVALLLLRTVAYSVLRKLRTQGYNHKTVVLVGKNQSSQYAQTALSQSLWSGFDVIAHLSVDELPSWLAEQENKPGFQLDEVWLCLPLSDEDNINAAINILCHSTANIRLLPDIHALKILNYGVREVMGITMLDLSVSPVSGAIRLQKTVYDTILASFILMLTAPLMLLIALIIKCTSPGPVLFKQRRSGWNGEDIWIYKFRSMVVHEEVNAQLTQAKKNDARVTPLGAFLRHTSLDELPQFINVLQGRLSIVGPRPHAVEHNSYYMKLIPQYTLRHKVKPGITGWAQIHGYRGETDTLNKMEKRVEYDLYYIEHLSMWLDLQIILTTIIKGFIHKNAY